MDKQTKSKIFGACLLAALGAITGLMTAPLGVPLMLTFTTKEPVNFTNFGQILYGGDPLGSWAQFMTATLGRSHGLTIIAAWCVIVACIIGVALALHLLNQPTRQVDRGILGDAKLIKANKEIRQRNDYWNGVENPREPGSSSQAPKAAISMTQPSPIGPL